MKTYCIHRFFVFMLLCNVLNEALGASAHSSLANEPRRADAASAGAAPAGVRAQSAAQAEAAAQARSAAAVFGLSSASQVPMGPIMPAAPAPQSGAARLYANAGRLAGLVGTGVSYGYRGVASGLSWAGGYLGFGRPAPTHRDILIDNQSAQELYFASEGYERSAPVPPAGPGRDAQWRQSTHGFPESVPAGAIRTLQVPMAHDRLKYAKQRAPLDRGEKDGDVLLCEGVWRAVFSGGQILDGRSRPLSARPDLRYIAQAKYFASGVKRGLTFDWGPFQYSPEPRNISQDAQNIRQYGVITGGTLLGLGALAIAATVLSTTAPAQKA